MAVTASATHNGPGAFAIAGAFLFSNDFNVYGGGGGDDIDVTLSATAAASAASGASTSSAMVYNNTLKIYGDGGADTIDMTLKATVGGGSLSVVSNNKAYISGGDGGDTITVNLTGNTVTGNDVVLFGGAGVDTIQLTNANTQVVMYYENVSELGATADLVSGLGPGAGITFKFFTGAAGASDFNAGVLNDAAGIWGYDSSANTLWYDADGGEGAGSAIDVAQFTPTDVSITLAFTAADWAVQVT